MVYLQCNELMAETGVLRIGDKCGKSVCTIWKFLQRDLIFKEEKL
jgi:hypothetical protein